MGKGIQASDDDNSMDEEVAQTKQVVPGIKRVRIKKPKRPRGPGEEPTTSHLVSGMNMLEATKRKLKIKSALALKRLSRANPSVLKEFQLRKKEVLKEKLAHKKKKEQILEKNLSKGQRKREKKKNMTMKKKDFLEYLQIEASHKTGGHEQRDKKGTFSMVQMGSTLDKIDLFADNGKQIEHTQNNPIKPKNDLGMNEIVRVSSIAKMKAFSQNPLAALKTHITNN